MKRRTLRELNGLTTPPAAEKALKKKRKHPSWAEMKSAAERFEGVEDWLQAKNDLRHISRTPSGYQIRIDRYGKRVFDTTTYGHTEKSLLEAVRLRDEALRRWPTLKRSNSIPPAVLQALGLTEPVVGVTRLPSRSSYRVSYCDRAGRRRLKNFYYRVMPEEVAYAAAIDFIHRELKK